MIDPKKELLIGLVLIVVAVLLIFLDPLSGKTMIPQIESQDFGEPKEAYPKYLLDLQQATTFDDYVILVFKYGSSGQIESIKNQMDQVNSLPPEFKQDILNHAKETTPKLEEIDTIEQKIIGINARLEILANNNTILGEIDFIQEEDIWKINNEKWSPAPQNSSA